MSGSKKTNEQRKKDLLKGIKTTAKMTGKLPIEVTPSDVYASVDYVTSWDIRTIGGTTGFSQFKKIHFPLTDKQLALVSSQKKATEYINKLEKEVGNKLNQEEFLLATIKDAIKKLKPVKFKTTKRKVSKKKPKLIMELMLSDLHFGKKSKTFNLKILRERLTKLTDEFLDSVKKKEKEGYQFDKIVLALIGDIIESYTMHGAESSLSCEFGNSEQVYQAIQGLFDLVILPIAKTGIPIEIPAVAGNHDRTEKNRTFNNPGENYVTWIIYNALKDYCKLSGMNNVKFIIPKDCFTVIDIFGHATLYEHGENLKNTSKTSVEHLMIRRSRQINKTIDMYRGGHWHEAVNYDRGRIIINESACGQDSYSEIKGYTSVAGQTINYYVNDGRPNSFLYSYNVYLG